MWSLLSYVNKDTEITWRIILWSFHPYGQLICCFDWRVICVGHQDSKNWSDQSGLLSGSLDTNALVCFKILENTWDIYEKCHILLSLLRYIGCFWIFLVSFKAGSWYPEPQGWLYNTLQCWSELKFLRVALEAYRCFFLWKVV